jgi:hypothetical protein
MARPRIFVSSTFYDLKHIRSSLDIFIESLGYDSILSEKGDIAYAHDIALDESCYREVRTADIFVLIIGGRYGSPSSRESEQTPRDFYERYKSVTKQEHDEALSRDIPIFILVESAVYAEFKTYLRNKGVDSIRYAHVDSENVFLLLEEILGRRKNNPIHTFERFSDIENWLREQWAGLFREYLNRTSTQRQIAALTDQITTLQEVSSTLKRYLEAVVQKVSPDVSAELIRKEQERLEEAEILRKFAENLWVRHVVARAKHNHPPGLTLEAIRDFHRQAKSFDEYCSLLGSAVRDVEFASSLYRALQEYSDARDYFNDARDLLGETRLEMKPMTNIQDFLKP